MKNIPFEIGKTFNILRGFIHIEQFEISKKKGKLDFNDLIIQLSNLNIQNINFDKYFSNNKMDSIWI